MANDAGSAAGLAEAAYGRHVGGDPPDDLDATVAALPSMVGALTELADADPERVVVDLRDNPGETPGSCPCSPTCWTGWRASSG
ncbi:hypothetical protein [Halosegnis marinus]|uniref:hypothetical protein n=1 Tax=Halosegnis marinus TaxID=3034023 RepID=UPI00360FF7B0